MTFFKCSLNRPHADQLDVLASNQFEAARAFVDAWHTDLVRGVELDVRVRHPIEDELPDEIWRAERFEGQTLARYVGQSMRSRDFIDLWAVPDNIGL